MTELDQIYKIKELISGDKLKEAFREFRKIGDSSITKDTILLEGRFSNLISEWNKGILSDTSNIVERNRIRTALLNYLQDYEFECIRRIDESSDEIGSLVKLIYAKTSIDDNFLNYLTQLRTGENKHELEAIKRLILYEYKASSMSSYINKIIRLKYNLQITLSKILSFGIHTIVFSASDQASKSFILKVLHPKFYDIESASFKERHDKQKSLSREYYGVAEVYEIINIPKNEIIIAKICKYDTDLRDFILTNSDQSGYYELISDMFGNLCNVVRQLHYKGVAHRDIAPSNIFINNKKEIFLGDFDNIFIEGSSESEEDVRYRSKKNDDIFFDVFIDPYYISKLNNGDNFTCTFEEAKEVDLYSLCVTLLFCIVRTRFSNNIELLNFLKEKSGGDSNDMKLFAIDIIGFTDFSNKINAKVQEFLEKGLSRNKKNRYKNIDDLISNFNSINEDLKPSISNIPFKVNMVDKFKFYLPIILLVFSTIYILILYSKSQITQDWIESRAQFFSNSEIFEINKFMNDSKVLSLPTDAGNIKIDKERVMPPDKDVGRGVLSATKGLLSDAYYEYASLQVIKDTTPYTEIEKNIFEKFTQNLLRDAEFKENYADPNKTIGIPPNISDKIQAIQIFIYYEKNKRILFYRYPKTGLNTDELAGYEPQSRPWYKVKGLTGISEPYYSYSTKQNNPIPIRTLVKKVKTNESEIIFGIDVQIK